MKKILLININFHEKNMKALLRYNCLIHCISNTNIENIDLSLFDLVYSPFCSIDTKQFPNTKFLFGPHFSVFPMQTKINLIKSSNSVYIHPSDWSRDVWRGDPICNNLRIETLPFGVDTNKFNEIKPSSERGLVFLYFKRRNPSELQVIRNLLESKNIKYHTFLYGGYNEEEYLSYLHQSKYGIWLDAHESQGFALQEALSCNVPLFVWNVESMSQEYKSNYPNIPASTIPYWNAECGEFITNEEQINDKFDEFISKVNNNMYSPRNLVLNNLSIAKCREKFLNLIESINTLNP